MSRTSKTPNSGFAAGILAGALLAGLGVVLSQLLFGPLLSRSMADPEEQMLTTVHRNLVEDYVNPPGSQAMLHAAVSGMIDGLQDPYCAFVGPEDLIAYGEDSSGQLIGVGIQLADGGVVRYPQPEGPAEAAGIEPGDVILAVDGVDVTTMLRTAMVDRIKGEVGTLVHLQLRRGESAQASIYEVDIPRQAVPTGTVGKVEMIDPERGIGRIHIRSFAAITAAELDAALDLLLAQGMRGLVLDLRFNRGGLLEAAVACSSRFLKGGLVCTLEGRRQTRRIRKANAKDNKVRNLPLAILMNDLSASGSEVLAGALRDYGAAVLVGQRSYGKGVYQQVQYYKDGDFRIKFTAGYYITPAGRVIEGSIHPDFPGGLEPDLPTPLPPPIHRRALAEWLRYQAPPLRYRARVFELFPFLAELQSPPDEALDAAVDALVLAQTV